jgi:hypothetical protein
MLTSVRTALFSAAGLASVLGLAGHAASGAESAVPPQEEVWTSMNHWVVDLDPEDDQEAEQHAFAVMAHMHESHPEVRFGIFKTWTGVYQSVNRYHFFMESVNTRAKLSNRFDDHVCAEQNRTEKRLFDMVRDVELRLISSDPKKEARVGPTGGLIVRSLRARTPLVGRAADAIRELTEYLNRTYPEIYVRAYDEWHPRSGRLHLHIHGKDLAGDWERIEGELRRDQQARLIWESAADAFVEDSFEDAWLVRVAR